MAREIYTTNGVLISLLEPLHRGLRLAARNNIGEAYEVRQLVIENLSLDENTYRWQRAQCMSEQAEVPQGDGIHSMDEDHMKEMISRIGKLKANLRRALNEQIPLVKKAQYEASQLQNRRQWNSRSDLDNAKEDDELFAGMNEIWAGNLGIAPNDGPNHSDTRVWQKMAKEFFTDTVAITSQDVQDCIERLAALDAEQLARISEATS